MEVRHDLAQVIIRELEANHYRVIYAPDGHTALHLHQEEKPDIVILDWMLPDLNGLDKRDLQHELRTPIATLRGYLENNLKDHTENAQTPPSTIWQDLEIMEHEVLQERTIEAMGGSIAVESTLGEGSRFTLYLLRS